MQSESQIIHFNVFLRLQTIARFRRDAVVHKMKHRKIMEGFSHPFDRIRYCECQVSMLLITECGRNSREERTILNLYHLVTVFVVEVGRHDI